MLTVLGAVVSSVGLSVRHDAFGEAASASILPARAYNRAQPADLPVYFDHDPTWRLGGVEYLERGDGLGLLACARLDADVASLLERDGPWYWSDSVTCRRLGDHPLYKYAGALRELSLVRATANGGTWPVVWCQGDITRGSTPFGGPPMPLPWRDTWERAGQAMIDRRYRLVGSTDIVDVDPLDPVSEALTSGASLAEAGAILTPPAPPTPRPSPPPHTGPTVQWFGQELGGELAEKIIEAIQFGEWPPVPAA